jgi:hypothetical protein
VSLPEGQKQTERHQSVEWLMQRGIGRPSLPTHLDVVSLALLKQRLGQRRFGLIKTLLIDE